MKGYGLKTHFTRHSYSSRGATRQRDFIYEGLVGNKCLVCEKNLIRKQTEYLSAFLKRKTCGYIYVDGKRKKGECMRLLFTGKGNPHYKGMLDRPCTMCGKIGLSYVCSLKGEKQTEMCQPCRNKNKLAWNKKDTVLLPCTRCGKEISNRWGDNKLRWRKDRQQIFCSKTCANKTRVLKIVNVSCKKCGKIISVSPCRAKYRKSCSLKCNR